MLFHDRAHAGRELAAWFLDWPDTAELTDPLVLALPRGGVPVAAEVARALTVPLDVLVARKIGVPGHAEVGVGAIAGAGPPVFDSRTLEATGLTEDRLADDVARERAELQRRETAYRGDRPAPVVRGRAVLLIDDGLATGATARAALRHLSDQQPARLILAVPVCSPHTAETLRHETDDLVSLHQPPDFHAVGEWYTRFDQTSDAEVEEVLREFRDER